MPSEQEPPEIPIVCPACETRTEVPFSDVEATVARHNEQLHGGEEIAAVDPAVLEELTDIVAEDLGLLES